MRTTDEVFDRVMRRKEEAETEKYAENTLIKEKKGEKVSMKKMTKVLIAAAVCLAIVTGTVTVGAAVMKRHTVDELRELYSSPWKEYIAGNCKNETDLTELLMQKANSLRSLLKDHDTESDLSKALSGQRTEYDAFYEGEVAEIISEYANMKLDDLPEKPLYCLSSRNRAARYGFDLIYTSNVGFNANYIEKLDDDHIAVIYRFYDDEDITDYEPHYAAMIFSRTIQESLSGDGTMYEIWNSFAEMYIIDGVHSSEEYADIRIGDKVGALYDIDASIRFDIRRHTYNQSDEAKFLKILSDGILEVKYEYDFDMRAALPGCLTSMDGDSDRVITSIEFYPFSGTERPLSEYSELSENKSVSVNDASILNFLK